MSINKLCTKNEFLTYVWEIEEICSFSPCFPEVSRNDSCPDLPEIQNGWKTTSHAALVRGARITYQCDPGYDLVGSETLTCQVDLSWNTQPPFCEKSESSISLCLLESEELLLSADSNVILLRFVSFSSLPLISYVLHRPWTRGALHTHSVWSQTLGWHHYPV